MAASARLSRRAGAAALGRGRDDAARQRRGARRAAGGARDRAPCVADDARGSRGCSIERRRTSQGLEDWQLANLREMRRQRDHAIATPVSLISRLARATARAEVAWAERAPRQTTSSCSRRTWKKCVHLVRDKAALLGQALGLPPYDALMDEFSPGLSHRRHRHHLQGAVAPAAGTDSRSARRCSSSARRCRSAASSPPASSAPWWSK